MREVWMKLWNACCWNVRCMSVQEKKMSMVMFEEAGMEEWSETIEKGIVREM